MPKRKRSSCVELIAVIENGIVIEWNRKEYYVCCGSEYVKHFDDSDLECTIIHNTENRAMLNIEDIRSGEDLLRQEINPFKYKDIEEWVRDDQ
jgi:hypothetical protein